MVSLKYVNFIFYILLFFNNFLFKVKAKIKLNSNSICNIPHFPNYVHEYKEYTNYSKIINYPTDTLETSNEYGKTDYIKIKRFKKKITETNYKIKNFKPRNQQPFKKSHFSIVGRDINEEYEKTIPLKPFNSDNYQENDILNKRKIDNFIAKDTLYSNQFFGSQLNDIEMYIYDTLVRQLKNVTLLSFFVNIDFGDEYSVKLKDIFKIIERVFGAISMDHPDICKSINGQNKNIDSQNYINIYKSNSDNRLNFLNTTEIVLSHGDEGSDRRIKMKRDTNEQNTTIIDNNDFKYLSEIQLHLCSSPKDNICNIYTINDINRMNKLIENQIQNILKNAKLYFQQKHSKMNNIHKNDNNDSNNETIQISEYDFIKYLHNLLIKNVQYGFSDNGFTEYTIYGALIEHRCVCEGFSEAFMIIAQRVKIYTVLATSNTHQWNMVYLEGKWYALDITWDIPNYSSHKYIFKNRKIGKLKKDKNFISSNTLRDDEFDFNIENEKLFDIVNMNFFLIGNKTVVKEKNKMIFQNEPNHQLCNYIIYQYALGFRYPTLDNNKYNNKSIYKKYIHINLI
ncbi:hypothetical protein LY90DRAFT_498770 [Neocallimastix californiae]|uniref:Transglutaminase-like domain-containing protein n=1 Tax=Neocallimastix californiae TaxID=1754190 RepID=A0A1Y2FTL8_9FUNG|nr:hypothetical protein LY90DRAFT_498770 [Neocallimastix californiae]|eukprot:ORY86536.1 hypothetical protein LY90DRAFT_498770 [Neocallimastix californiae]